MSRAARVMGLLKAMTDDERAEFFQEVSETYCVDCGEELPDEDSKDPDHDCPFAEEEDEDDEDDEDEDDEDDEEDAASEPD